MSLSWSSFPNFSIVGILNASPDSFSDTHPSIKYSDHNYFIEKALKLKEEGADIIDIGAESTRPGALDIPAEEQIKRLSFLSQLSAQINLPLSIDTRSFKVARFAFDSGVSILNDVSSLRADPTLFDWVKQQSFPFIVMHHKSPVSQMHLEDKWSYKNLVEEIYSDFKKMLQYYVSSGIDLTRMVVDLGFGFSKRGTQNLELLKSLEKFHDLKCPLYVGLSRKSFLEPFEEKDTLPRERRISTELAHFLCLSKGVQFIRTHDVAALKRTIEFYLSVNQEKR